MLVEEARRKGLIVWMDMEMSGLEPDRDRILEIATIVTDADLKVIAEGPELVIHQPESVLDAMDDWNRKHHGESGLIERVRASRVTEAEAEDATLEFLRGLCEPRTAPLAGNSIHQDRRFLYRYMPRVSDHLHYRLIDVSTVKELGRRWFPSVLDRMPSKRNAHRAIDDVRESIEELRFYRRNLFRSF
jgi:oligoribonuclease